MCEQSDDNPLFHDQETEHLQKFSMTWEIHNKHLYQSIIYSDPVVQNSLPELMSQLQKG